MIGCSVIFYNQRKQVLLYLRDFLPSIPEAGKWDLFGGRVENGETPDEAIRREIREEIWVDGRGLEITQLTRFKVYEFPDRQEHVFTCPLEKPEAELILKEGQRLQWFASAELELLDIGFGFEPVLREFLRKYDRG